MKNAEGLLLHLSKFPSLSGIFPMGQIEEAMFAKNLGMWYDEHRKLTKEVLSQIQALYDSRVNDYSRGTIVRPAEIHLSDLKEVLALLEGSAMPQCPSCKSFNVHRPRVKPKGFPFECLDCGETWKFSEKKEATAK